jgi:hypothetical protein
MALRQPSGTKACRAVRVRIPQRTAGRPDGPCGPPGPGQGPVTADALPPSGAIRSLSGVVASGGPHAVRAVGHEKGSDPPGAPHAAGTGSRARSRRRRAPDRRGAGRHAHPPRRRATRSGPRASGGDEDMDLRPPAPSSAGSGSGRPQVSCCCRTTRGATVHRVSPHCGGIFRGCWATATASRSRTAADGGWVAEAW